MKNSIIAVVMAATVFALVPLAAGAKTTYVRGYYKPSTGTYVMPYYKTSSNSTKLDNFSTKGNYNPYSGKKGYVNPYKW